MGTAKRVIKYLLSGFGVEVRRYQRSLKSSVVSLQPKITRKGNVLICDEVTPFLPKSSEFLVTGQNRYWEFLIKKNNDPVLNSHGSYWQVAQVAQTFLDLGYSVDVIQYDNEEFIPKKKYDIFTGYGRNFERLSRLLEKDCIKIFYILFNHWVYHNTAQYERISGLKQRKQAILKPRRLLVPDAAIEHADCAITVGGELAATTYLYAKKPIFHVSLSTIAVYDWPEDKDFEACRNNFLWFGGLGLLHKGLDLVLDAFREMPDKNLTVCGPVDTEEDFKTLYHKELFETPNIHVTGWVDVTSPDFVATANNCIGLVFASCSECGAGSVITGMQTGLIPIVSYESSVQTGDFGVGLKDCQIETIKETIKVVSEMPAEDLKRRARKAWEYARANHTRGRFAAEYRRAIEEITSRSGRDAKRESCDCVGGTVAGLQSMPL